MEEKIEFPKNDGSRKQQKHRALTVFLIVGLLVVVICAVGTRAYRKHVADEALRREVAATEARRMAALQTVRNAHDFFGKGEWRFFFENPHVCGGLIQLNHDSYQ